MRLTLSPYDLTHRAPGVMAALLVADAAATIVPVARAWTSGDPEAAVEESPALGRVFEAWRWAAPLWGAGVLGPMDAAGRSSVELVRSAAEEVADARTHPVLARLAGRKDVHDLTRLAEDLCLDIVRGGRNPGLTVPVGAALERFAAESGWPVVLCPTGTMVGGIEHKLAMPIAGLDLPAPVGAGGEALVVVRERMADVLESVRAAWAELMGAIRGGGTSADIAEIERQALGPAGEAVCAAAAELADPGARGRASEWTMVRWTVAALPANAMVRAAEIAAGQVSGAARGEGGGRAGAIERAGALAVVVRQLPWDVRRV